MKMASLIITSLQATNNARIIPLGHQDLGSAIDGVTGDSTDCLAAEECQVDNRITAVYTDIDRHNAIVHDFTTYAYSEIHTALLGPVS